MKAEPQQTIDRITLKAFRAPDEPALCDEFIREHEQVLSDFGIPLTVKPDNSWVNDPECYVIVALHAELGMVGGIKLQMDNGKRKLPMLEAVEKMDPRIADELAQLRVNGNGEVCGLWNANRYANRGVPILLSLAVTAIATQAEARHMVCFVAHYTKKHPSKNGFIVMENIGEKGSFDYPVPRIKSICMVNPDTVLLPHASLDQRQRIFSLRLRPQLERIENPSGTELLVQYDLLIGDFAVDMVAYQGILKDRLSYSA